MPSTATTQPNALNARRSVDQPENDPLTSVEQILADWWVIAQRSETIATGASHAWMQISGWCHGAYRYARCLDIADAKEIFEFAALIASERATMEIG